MAKTRIDEPERTCVGCRTKRPATHLVRLTQHDGHLVIDGGSAGRGAWICRSSIGCLDQAVRRRALQRAWRTSLESDQIELLHTAIREALAPTGTI